MKKLLAIILVLMLAFSTLLITACNKDNTADTSPESSSTQETTSTRKRGEGAGSGENTGVTPTSSDSTSDETPTSDDDETSTSSDDGTSSGGGSENQPQGSEYKFSEYDYTYQTGVTEPAESTSPAGKLDLLLYLFAGDFDKPTLTDNFYSALADYEARYEALSDADKKLVKNAPFLQEARTAYNDMAKRECEKIINELPDATIDNLTEFAVLSNAVGKLLSNLGSAEANNVQNITTYNNKVSAADSLLTDTFNAKVTELQAFEYSTAYKAKLDDAEVIYGLMNASQQSKVSESFTKLTTLKTKYSDTAIAKTFEEKVLGLPDVANLTDSNKADVLELKGLYGKLTSAQQGLISQNAKTKFTELEKWFAAGRIAYIFEDEYVRTGEKSWVKLGKISKDEYSAFKISSDASFKTSQSETHGIFEGVDYINKGCNQLKSGTTIEITITKPAIFVICCNPKKEGKSGTITFTRNGTSLPELETPIVFSADGTNCEYKFNLSEPGTYVATITTPGDSIRVFALALY